MKYTVTDNLEGAKRPESGFAFEIPGQSFPFVVKGEDDTDVAFVKIDEAYSLGDFAVIVGWTVGANVDVKFSLHDHKVLLEYPLIREDVSSAYPQYNSPSAFMQVVACENPGLAVEALFEVDSIVGGFAIRLAPWSLAEALNHDHSEIIFRAIGREIKVGSSAWDDYLSVIPEPSENDTKPSAYLEAAIYSDVSGLAVLVGWSMTAESMWVEDENGNAYALDAVYRSRRKDVETEHGNELRPDVNKSGLIATVKLASKPNKLTLWAIDKSKKVALGQCPVQRMGMSPEHAAKWLFSLPAPMSDMASRIETIDAPVISPLQEAWNSSLKLVEPEVVNYGELPSSPKASVIVPLYARHDFMEYQLMGFSNDSWFKEHVELVYVVDDPRLVSPVKSDAEYLQKLYRVPFKVVYSELNRGFSGANNLGVNYSQADHFLFMNSDVFPQKSGWLKNLLNRLINNPEFGAIGPVLQYGDGSTQHAGMDYKYRKDLGIWVNYHPKMGLESDAVMGKGLQKSVAITGACVLMSRQLCRDIGGWCEDYLIGDFEDSDLCFQIKSKGYEVGVDTELSLTHLERQSFTDLGEPAYRTKVVIYNAVKHQNKWHRDQGEV